MKLPKSAAAALLATAMLSENHSTYIPNRKRYDTPDNGNHLRKHQENITRRHKRRIAGRSRSLNHKS